MNRVFSPGHLGVFFLKAGVLLYLLQGLPQFGPHPVVADEPLLRPVSLVQTALQAEVEGRNDRRQALLKEAIDRDPEFAPARHQMGQMQLDGRWLTVEEAQRAALDDAALKEYHRLRIESSDDFASQRQLAIWCEDHDLSVEARAHWTKVLWHDPKNGRALRALGLQYFHGELLAEDEIEQLRQEEVRQHKAARQWSTTLVRLRREIDSGDFRRRRRALEQLHGIDDPSAIPSLEKLFSGESRELAAEVVQTLGGMPDHDATLSLLRHAVYSKWSTVRREAAEQLSARSMHDYVPLLLDQLIPPVQTKYRINSSLAGDYILTQLMTREGPFSRQVLVDTRVKRTILIIHEYAFSRASRSGGAVSISSRRIRTNDPSGLDEIARQNAINVDTMNRQVEEHNEQFLSVLRKATSVDQGALPIDWWQWWQDYNEIHAPNKPTFVQRRGGYINDSVVAARLTFTSCFLAGTPVWTRTGVRPIETIELGDQVLAQDPETGELAFKPVLATTLRPPAEMLDLTFAGESIKTTRGHPFWLDGDGWRMAKLLEAGEIVHGLRGGVVLDTIGDAPKAEAHNLVVGDFHNYFVGDGALLVHDNTPRTPTTAIVPGLLAGQ